METKTYVALKNPVNSGTGTVHNELRIEVDYQKGGINWFSGDYCDSGVFVYLRPVHRGNGFEGCSIDNNIHVNGYKILLKQINRKSQKQINLMAEKIMPYAQQIADLYSDGKHQKVLNLVESIKGT